MIYGILKIVVRLASIIFCRKIIVNNTAVLNQNGPLLIAANHPNSFLDAVIIDILFKRPVWSLARGDAFINKRVSSLLKAFRILPVYRTSEGKENLTENYNTFDTCIEIFQQQGIVQIFSEGQCFNEWHLRPLKKGTARLANLAWDKNVPLLILPLALNYSSFTRFGKNVFVNIGTPIDRSKIDITASEGIRNQQFNAVLQTELQKLVYEIPKNDKKSQKQLLELTPDNLTKTVLFVPSVIGWLLHAPIYLPLKWIANKYHRNTGHYDSLLITLVVFSYAPYLLLLTFIAYTLSGSLLSLLLLIILPFCAWSHVQLKGQLDD